jgi:adenylylsulfate kinase-like enzyme
MIILFFGQPASGKTTLADKFFDALNSENKLNNLIRIDGDIWRDLSKNKDYSKDGRIANLMSAFTTAKFLDNNGFNPVLSFVTPYEELRQYLMDGNEVLLIHLNYLHLVQDRGRNMNFAKDFEKTNFECLKLNTSLLNVDMCVDKCIEYLNSKKTVV